MKSTAITITALAGLILSQLATPAVAEDGCGFGKSIQYESNEGDWVYDPEQDNYTLPDGSVVDDVSDLVDNDGSCERTSWIDNDENDGFDRTFSVSIGSDEEGQGANSFETLEIFCINKKLSVYIWVDFPNTRGWSGKGQVRLDSGKTKSFGYKVNRAFDGLYLDSPKAFTKSFLTSKSKATFKIQTLDGTKVLAYPKADLATYAGKFKRLGCPLR